jgi:hypothetical protein
MGWIGCIRYEKSRRDFVARTFALIAPFHPVLHRVSCIYETIPNAPKHYERHQNMSLVSNGVDQVRLLGKITTWLRGTNICINCSSSSHFAPNFMQLRNDPKCTQILQNILKLYFRVQWGGLGAFLAKNTMWLRGTNFCINCTISVCFAPSFMQLRNYPKCTQTLWNTPKHEFRVQRGRLGAFVAKNPDMTSWHELLH